MEKMFHGQIKLIFLVRVNTLGIFEFVRLLTIFILDKLNVLNKELQQYNSTCRICSEYLKDCNQLSDIFNNFLSNTSNWQICVFIVTFVNKLHCKFFRVSKSTLIWL